MSIEYLIYTQNYLETLTKTLDLHYKQAYEETIKVRDAICSVNIIFHIGRTPLAVGE